MNSEREAQGQLTGGPRQGRFIEKIVQVLNPVGGIGA
jgi:hypothetical protein